MLPPLCSFCCCCCCCSRFFVAADFEIDDVDSAVAWDFFECFADYSGTLDDVVESAVWRFQICWKCAIWKFLLISRFFFKVSYSLWCNCLSFHQGFDSVIVNLLLEHESECKEFTKFCGVFIRRNESPSDVFVFTKTISLTSSLNICSMESLTLLKASVLESRWSHYQDVSFYLYMVNGR